MAPRGINPMIFDGGDYVAGREFTNRGSPKTTYENAVIAPRIGRVVIINDESIATGGATGIAMIQVRELRKRGISVTYIAGDDGKSDFLKDLGVEVVAAHGKALLDDIPARAMVGGIYNLKASNVVRRWIGANDTPDTIYHLHQWSKIFSPAIFSVLHQVSRRTVLHIHDFFYVCPNGAFMDFKAGTACHREPLSASCLSTNCDRRNYSQKLWRVARQAALNAILAQGADWHAVLLVHQNMAPYFKLKPNYVRGLQTVINPVEPYVDKRVTAEDHKKLLFVGRVDAHKGIVQALKAARSANMPLIVVGDGPMRARLEAEWPDVKFYSWQGHQQIARIVQEVRALIMPSVYPEPFGLVSAESSLSGLPVLMSDISLPAKDFSRNNIGITFDVNDHASIVAAISKIRDMPYDEIRQMSEHAFSRRATLALDMDEWTQILLDIYQKALHP